MITASLLSSPGIHYTPLIKKNSLACAGVVVLVNGSDGAVEEDGETSGVNMCLGAARGEESADWGRAVSLSCMSLHARMHACYLKYRLRELGRNEC